MGTGTNSARIADPKNAHYADAIDNMKDQLIVVLLKRLGSDVKIPVSEIDGTGGDVVSMSLNDNVFNFVVSQKH